MFKTAFLALAASGLLAASAQAASINARQDRQAERIAHGAASGALTGREAARLTAAQAGLAAQEARMRADGPGLTPSERARLDARLDRQSTAIRLQKSDRQTAG